MGSNHDHDMSGFKGNMMTSNRWKFKKSLLTLAGVLVLSLLGLAAGAAKPIELGLLQDDADNHNAEFSKYDLRLPLFYQNNIAASLAPWEAFFAEDWSEDKIYQLLKQYDAVVLSTTDVS